MLTLRFSPTLGRFDDAPLVALQQKVVLEGVREHLVQVGGEPMLLCVVSWQEKPTAAMGTAQPSPCSEAAPAAQPAADEPRGPARPVGELRNDLSDDDRILFETLRHWRRTKAHDEGVPSYVILTDRQLVELVRRRPNSRTGLHEIHGLGDKKIARHGQEILAILWPEAGATGPAQAATAAIADAGDPGAAADAAVAGAAP
ncbi:MAG: HRDC domain-containing protein [Planctomycetota bacterium]